jgi:endonuclease/exonuclease/phosphatase family metal-dependent hydrolase
MRIVIVVLAMHLATFMSAQTMSALKVMTYNIRYDNPADGINQWGNRKEKVFQLVKKYNPDIIGVQEALHHQLLDMTTNFSAYSFIGAGRDDGKEKGEYSAILYRSTRFEVLQQNTFWLSEKPEKSGSKSWDAAITRIATWALLRDKNSQQKFLLINTHFDHVGKEARAKSAELIKAKVSALAENVPVIITGDLNCLRDEAPYTIFMEPTTIELIDPAPQNPPGTFCNFEVNSIPCKGIDYIFHTNEWRADNYKVIQDNDGKYYPSDHLPVLITFTLQD